MTKLLYLEDAYLQEFPATVVEVVNGGVVLDQSAFYPGGGGQPCDFGTLAMGENMWQVSKVKRVANLSRTR